MKPEVWLLFELNILFYTMSYIGLNMRHHKLLSVVTNVLAKHSETKREWILTVRWLLFVPYLFIYLMFSFFLFGYYTKLSIYAYTTINGISFWLYFMITLIWYVRYHFVTHVKDTKMIDTYYKSIHVQQAYKDNPVVTEKDYENARKVFLNHAEKEDKQKSLSNLIKGVIKQIVFVTIVTFTFGYFV